MRRGSWKDGMTWTNFRREDAESAGCRVDGSVERDGLDNPFVGWKNEIQVKLARIQLGWAMEDEVVTHLLRRKGDLGPGLVRAEERSEMIHQFQRSDVPFGESRHVYLHRRLVVIQAASDDLLLVLSFISIARHRGEPKSTRLVLLYADEQVVALCTALDLEELAKLENASLAT
jgi:hypothetical protein